MSFDELLFEMMWLSRNNKPGIFAYKAADKYQLK